MTGHGTRERPGAPAGARRRTNSATPGRPLFVGRSLGAHGKDATGSSRGTTSDTPRRRESLLLRDTCDWSQRPLKKEHGRNHSEPLSGRLVSQILGRRPLRHGLLIEFGDAREQLSALRGAGASLELIEHVVSRRLTKVQFCRHAADGPAERIQHLLVSRLGLRDGKELHRLLRLLRLRLRKQHSNSLERSQRAGGGARRTRAPRRALHRTSRH